MVAPRSPGEQRPPSLKVGRRTATWLGRGGILGPFTPVARVWLPLGAGLEACFYFSDAILEMQVLSDRLEHSSAQVAGPQDARGWAGEH